MNSNSSPTSYATPNDFILRVDVNIPGLLSRDDYTLATPEALLNDPVLQTCLEDASGALEAQCLIAGRYRPEDLRSLTGMSQQFLKRIICGLALQYLRWRRGIMEPSTYPMAMEAMKWLDALSDGEAIFAFSQVEDAGKPHTEAITPMDLDRYTPTRLTNNVRQWGNRANSNYRYNSYRY